ncbi:hypothetical protein CHLRE_13g575450v5 [Chlamydomonas reinhardtii]|uniref:Uncharacterized protein n=1 Tax=Chlamydomonas reinhardtii TaxID=3055 RepID=A0A2K3CZZ0_CHLRE|nr:uncharacterized protein CHLRE_13g575450v5 [Chlamydomonas reinhardtii]XP_042917424.1 uncharacterized protein CHLRE_13g575450v5 [Chlamydomonas reinhardtii]PNW73853.1 hypothetical protein CHLRE_13g575450v5 [Chlamydomonas reinhardtii]PNW73854.1 hypothetical protein CHLRE_13g575450v5 [Chlamydomonas reinhardtii]
MADVGPVLFAGDSVTRYQFMTFMHFLASGKYQHPFDGSQSLSDATEHWQTKLLNQYDQLWAHAGDQVEEHGSSGSGLHYTHNRSAHLERAHLSLRLQADTSRKAHLYYYYLGRGLDEITGAIKWAMGQRQDWRYLIVNVCAHYEKNRMGDISGDVIAAVQWAHETYTAAFAEAGTQLVWKSCTTPQDNVRERLDEEERKIAEYAAATGSLLVYDTRTVIQAATNQHLVTTWSPGEVHYLQFMYEQWNDLLLNILCPDREGAASAAGAADPDCEGVPPPSGAEGE